MKKMLLVFSVMAVVLSPVFAEEKADKDMAEKVKNIKKMIELTGGKATAKKLMNGMMENMKKMSLKTIDESIENDEFKNDPEMIAVRNEYMGKILDSSMKLYNIDELIDSMIPLYAKYMTNDDILGVIAFYESPAGKHMIEAVPKIMQEYMKTIMDSMPAKTKKIQENMKEMIKELTEKIKNIEEKKKKEKETK